MNKLAMVKINRGLLLMLMALLLGLLGPGARATQSIMLATPTGARYTGEILRFAVTGDNLHQVRLKVFRINASGGASSRTQVASQVLNSAQPRSQMVFQVRLGQAGWYQAEARASGAATAFDEVTFSIARRPAKKLPVPTLQLEGEENVNPPGNVTFAATGQLLKNATLRAWKLAPGGGQTLVYQLNKPMPVRPPKTSKKYNQYEPVIRWSAPLKTPGVYLVEASGNTKLKRLKYVRVSDIGLVTKRSPRELLVYAIRLSTGAPMPHVAIRADDKGLTETRYRGNGTSYQVVIRKPGPSRAALTGADGVARFASTPSNGVIQVAASAADGSRVYNQSAYAQEAAENDVKLFFYTERPIYRPGQKVFFKGVARRDLASAGKRGPGGALFAPVPNAKIKLEFTDAANEKFATLNIKTSATGAFAGEVKLKGDAPVGRYSVETFLRPAGAKTDEHFYNRFSVQEYRKPEYEVTLTPQLDLPYAVQGTPVKVLVRARYFFGGPVKNAELVYSGTEDGTTKLDENGEAVVLLSNPVAGNDSALPLYVQVTDEANRIVESELNISAPYAQVRPSIGFDKSVYNVQDNAKITVRTRDPLGRSVAGTAKVTLYYARKTRFFNRERLRNEETVEEVPFFTQTVHTDSYGVATLEARLGRAGYLRAEVVASDPLGRKAEYNTHIWSLGKEQKQGYYWGSYEFPGIEVTPDKTIYQPGETVRALITTHKETGYALLTLQADRIFWHRVVKLNGRVKVVEFKYPASAAPGAHLVGGTPQGRRWAQDTAYLKAIAPAQRLNITLQASKDEYRPGTTAQYVVTVKDGTGKPQRADVSLGLVDKAIYSLANDETPDPVEFFYGSRENRVSTSWLFPGEVQGGSYQRIEQAVPVRRNFEDTAYWNPFVTTNENGIATVKVPLPDNLTTWRATARAINSQTQVGATTNEIVVTKPLLTRLIVPRFLTQTDRVRAQVIVQNNLNTAQDVKVSLRGSGLTVSSDREEKGAQNGRIAAGGSASFYWMIGTDDIPAGNTTSLIATARSGASAGSEDSDAQEIRLPVGPRGFPVSRWANIVVQDGQGTLNLAQAPNAIANASRLRVMVSPSVAGPMLGALPSLIQYPYGCTEQTLSRFVPAMVAARAVKQLKLPAPETAAKLPEIVQAARSTLYSYQHDDGGWGWWQNDDSDPYMTAYAVYGLTLAKKNGYDIDRDRVLRGVRVLQSSFGHKEVTPDGRAYMMLAYASALEVWGFDQKTELETKHDYPAAVFEYRSKLSDYGLAALALAYYPLYQPAQLKVLLDELESRASRETSRSGEVVFWGNRGKIAPGSGGGWNDSDIEATALALQVLVKARPQSKLIRPVVQWLLQSRRGTQWVSTKDTAQVVIALSDYLQATGELTVDETVKLLVNGQEKASYRFTHADIGKPEEVLEIENFNSDAHLEIVRSGRGVAYVAAELVSYTPDTLQTGAQNGFKVTRRYQLQNEKGKWRDITGPIPSGALVRVDLRVEVERPYQYVLLEDFVPSGFEARPENDDLAHKAEQKCDCAADEMVVIDPPPGWSALPVSRRESRDNRQAWFVNALGKGSYYLRYILRPEQPGTRVAPPARIEAMYRPDFNGHSSEIPVEVE